MKERGNREIETERQKDRETEKLREIETERQRERKTWKDVTRKELK